MSGTRSELEAVLRGIDGKGYGAYREIEGEWQLDDLDSGTGDSDGRTVRLVVDHAQRDPFATPSRVRARLPGSISGLPAEACTPPSRAVGTSCLLARAFGEAAQSISRRRGSGRSGDIRIARPGQEVLRNSAVTVAPDGAVEARFLVGLPARGRRVLGVQARELLLEDLVAVIRGSLLSQAHEPGVLRRHADTNEDAETLRAELPDLGAVAFVANGARLPRRSGVDDRPLDTDGVVRFESPPSLRTSVELPNAGPVTGMIIPRGVTLIVGGGYHGKSTLLRAVQMGVYNHRPGDGRERVVSIADAVKVRAEDGRSVSRVDISGFVGPLPGGGDTSAFSTVSASGSTSQAAAIAEAMESGATALLIDEDTAATNFLIRDRRMQALVPDEREPIIPFIDRVRTLFEDHGVSTLLALGGSGDYLEVADTVIAMTAFLPSDVTERAAEVARSHPTHRLHTEVEPLPARSRRRPRGRSIDPSRGRRSVSLRVRDTGRIQLGTEEIDLSAVEQIASTTQARAIGEALVWLHREAVEETASVPELLDRMMKCLATDGLDALGMGDAGDLAAFRRHELAAALNRLRTLDVSIP